MGDSLSLPLPAGGEGVQVLTLPLAPRAFAAACGASSLLHSPASSCPFSGQGAKMTDFSSCGAKNRHDPAMKHCLGFSTAEPAGTRKNGALLALAPKPMNTD
ncbi:MAG: hypothetical protein RH863_13810 [Parvibaculum sp.]|uniref:hypothetical protein n=1 Tax=Parvibaculum sp. TaxID=2024848 RepID=UPI0032EC38AF